MMGPLAILEHEHKVISLVLKGIEKGAGTLAATLQADPQWLETIVDFVRNFTDRCHHSKEENHLFIRLEERGIPNEGGPIGVMLREHQQGREYIGAVAAVMSEAQAGEAQALQTAAQNLMHYVELLTAHIQKENQILFPLAATVLTEADLEELTEAFDRIEAEEMGEGTHERYHELAHQLGGH